MRMNMSDRGGRNSGGQAHKIHLGSISEKPYKKTKAPVFVYAMPLGISVAIILLFVFTDLDEWLAVRSSVIETLLYELAYKDALTLIFLLSSFFLGILCVCFIMYRLVSKHKGETRVSFHTYVDNQFYAVFDTLSSRISAEDRMYLESQKRINKKNNRLPPEDTDHLNKVKNKEIDSSRDNKDIPSVDAKAMTAEPLSGGQGYIDKLDDLPEYDPEGPNPFGKKE